MEQKILNLLNANIANISEIILHEYVSGEYEDIIFSDYFNTLSILIKIKSEIKTIIFKEEEDEYEI